MHRPQKHRAYTPQPCCLQRHKLKTCRLTHLNGCKHILARSKSHKCIPRALVATLSCARNSRNSRNTVRTLRTLGTLGIRGFFPPLSPSPLLSSPPLSPSPPVRACVHVYERVHVCVCAVAYVRACCGVHACVLWGVLATTLATYLSHVRVRMSACTSM